MYHKEFSQKNFDLHYSFDFRFWCASKGGMIFAPGFVYFPANCLALGVFTEKL
jgi:hypothetical protein